MACPPSVAGVATFPIRLGDGPAAAASHALPRKGCVSFATKICVLPFAQQVIGGANVLINVARLIKNVSIYVISACTAEYHVNRAFNKDKLASILENRDYIFLQNISKETRKSWNDPSLISRIVLHEINLASDNILQELYENATLLKSIPRNLQPVVASPIKETSVEKLPDKQMEEENVAESVADSYVKSKNMMSTYYATGRTSKEANSLRVAAHCYFIKELAKIRCENNMKGIGVGLIRIIPIVGTIYSAVKWHQGLRQHASYTV